MKIIYFILTALVSGAAITDNDFLTIDGGLFHSKAGDYKLLKGTNIGGWLIQETWMCPVAGSEANLNSIEALSNRGFSQDQIYALYKIYQDNWFTTTDLDNLQKLGITLLRVPFWYRNFMLTPEGKWINDNFDQNPGFQKLDWVLSEAGKRGIYVALDMHGCPGGQSTDHCCGTLGKNDLWTTQSYKDAMSTLWKAIATRYKNNPTVAFYDIMNEPNNNGGSGDHVYDPWQQSTWDKNNAIYKTMYTAIRSVDPNHAICMEGIWRLGNLPDPDSVGWTNVVYQLHLYDDTDAINTFAKEIGSYSSSQGVAAYVGEFSNMDGLSIFNQNWVSWTTWTYKGGKGSNGDWFIYQKNCDAADMSKDSYDTIASKWGSGIRTENGFTVTRVADLIKSHTA